MDSTDSEAMRTDALIVGGGFIGLALAVALSRAGLSAVVVDREQAKTQQATNFDGRTSAIAFGSARVLDGLGIWPKLAPLAAPIREIRVSDQQSPLFLHYDPRELGASFAGDALGYILENRDLRQVFYEAAAASPGVTLVYGAELVRLERGAESARAELADGRAIEARLAVAADGRESKLRREAGIAAARWSYPQTAIVCTVALEKDHRGIAHERFLPAGPFAILPMRGRQASIVWTERSGNVPRLMALGDAAFLEELKSRFGDFLGEIEVVGPRFSHPLGLVHADRYVDRRLVLAGDAAHAIHPIAGQGLNLGLRDVAVLAEVLADAKRTGRDIGSAAVLRRYERWRRFDAFTLIAATDGLNRLFSNDLTPVKLLRDLGLAAVNRVPGLKRFFMRHAMGLVGELPRLMRGEPL